MGRPLTIAHVDGEQGWSGGQVQVFLLLDGLRRRGHRNVLFCPPGSRQETVARERGIETVPVAMRNDLHLAAVSRIAAGLRTCGADVAHLHTGRANWLGGWAARRARVPAVTTRRMDHPVRRHLVNRLVYGRFVRFAVGIAPAVSRRLVEGGVDPAKVRTIWSTVDAAALAPATPRAAVRAALDTPDDALVLLLAAHLSHRKGFDVALRALAELVGEGDAGGWSEAGGADHDGRHVVAWIAGDGPERPALEALADALGIADRVRFAGRRDDVPDLLAAADVFVMPSRSEGLGIAALEAMAAGLPVVASAVGGLGEAVVDGRTGLLVPPDDPAALAAALGRLVDDGALRARLGAAGPGRVDEGFRPEQMVAAYEDLYREMLGEAPAARGVDAASR